MNKTAYLEDDAITVERLCLKSTLGYHVFDFETAIKCINWSFLKVCRWSFLKNWLKRLKVFVRKLQLFLSYFYIRLPHHSGSCEKDMNNLCFVFCKAFVPVSIIILLYSFVCKKHCTWNANIEFNFPPQKHDYLRLITWRLVEDDFIMRFWYKSRQNGAARLLSLLSFHSNFKSNQQSFQAFWIQFLAFVKLPSYYFENAIPYFRSWV